MELLAGLILIVLHSGNREAPEEGEKWQNGWPMEQSEQTTLTDQVYHLTRALFIAPQNNYDSNIKYH